MLRKPASILLQEARPSLWVGQRDEGSRQELVSGKEELESGRTFVVWILFFKRIILQPWPGTPKGCGFDFRSGHMPGLRVPSLVGVHVGGK